LNVGCNTGYKNYKIKLFQKNVRQDLGKELRANHKGTTDYHIMSVDSDDQTAEKARHECATYFFKQIQKMPRFTYKLDALAYSNGMRNMVYGMYRYTSSGSSIDNVKATLRGNDKEGYYIDFKPIRREGFEDKKEELQ